MIRTSIRKGGSPLDWQYSTGREKRRQWETIVSYWPTAYQVRLKPNFGKREEMDEGDEGDERNERDERRLPGALLRTERTELDRNCPLPSGPEVGGKAPTYITLV